MSTPPSQERPDPLKDEIAKDREHAKKPGRRKLSPAVTEVRLRRLVLVLLVLIPLIWWLTRLV
ncbi:hypothetical protein [Kocuria sp.]|uniref:hypothetical protein n=1 Tax=Kocuria sp. TaxID=1871328 RepID=UPI0026E03C3A|nr:hypothetical protein [Kocuria sp.]MDO5619728.1 hypothetical protein [Kocuria sp.]